MKMARDRKVAFVDFRFTDTIGKFHHITVPGGAGERRVPRRGEKLRRLLHRGLARHQRLGHGPSPDLSTATMDPSWTSPTLALICTAEIPDKGPYNRCPRSIAAKVTAHLKKTGVEIPRCLVRSRSFCFDSVVSQTDPHRMMFEIHCEEGSWSASDPMRDSGMGGGAPTQSGASHAGEGRILPLPPVDSLHDLRGEICKRLEALGVPSEVHHHEVGGADNAKSARKAAPRCAAGTTPRF